MERKLLKKEDGWEYIVCPVDDDQMSYGLYGFILKPLEASDGTYWIA